MKKTQIERDFEDVVNLLRVMAKGGGISYDLDWVIELHARVYSYYLIVLPLLKAMRGGKK